VNIGYFIGSKVRREKNNIHELHYWINSLSETEILMNSAFVEETTLRCGCTASKLYIDACVFTRVDNAFSFRYSCEWDCTTDPVETIRKEIYRSRNILKGKFWAFRYETP
jgi:hypothetical protein